VRQEFATHKAVFCSLLLRLSNDLRTKDTQELVDTLLLVWEGTALYDGEGVESQRIAARLPEIAARILLWHSEELRPAVLIQKPRAANCPGSRYKADPTIARRADNGDI
jgi:hypothetical protein